MPFRNKTKQTAGRRSAAPQPSRNKAVFSYYQNRDTEAEAGASRQRVSLGSRVKRRLQHVPTIIAIGLIVVSLLYALSLSAQPRVSVVNEQNVSSKALLRPISQYQAAAQKLLQQSLLTRNKLTLDTTAIEQALQDQFPEITNAAVVLPLISRTPVVYVQVAEPVLLLKSGSQTFVIDEKGRALVPADQAGDLSSLRLITVADSAQLNIQPGSQVLTTDEVAFMLTVRDQLAAKGMKVARMELPPQAGELRVFIEGKPYYVKFTTTGDALQQVGTYLALEQHLGSKKITPKEYVDVRVEERAYYK